MWHHCIAVLLALLVWLQRRLAGLQRLLDSPSPQSPPPLALSSDTFDRRDLRARW